ncbi:MAG: hypothetical protein IJ466_01705 [Clostridia bacterium]|nr:hypothetical protein [Clostridia bacterium]
MLHLRRLVWYIASRLILLCILLGMLVCTFYMCLNTANIYVILSDGLEKRAEVILTQEDAEKLNFYFHADFLSTDPALEGAFDGTSVYDDYTITDFEYELKVEKLWAWPWDSHATCTVVERVPEITGDVISSRKSEASPTVPSWQGGRYDITLVKVNGSWKIIGMQQTTVLMEAVNSAGT